MNDWDLVGILSNFENLIIEVEGCQLNDIACMMIIDSFRANHSNSYKGNDNEYREFG